jgi:hypothetical protein
VGAQCASIAFGGIRLASASPSNIGGRGEQQEENAGHDGKQTD